MRNILTLILLFVSTVIMAQANRGDSGAAEAAVTGTVSLEAGGSRQTTEISGKSFEDILIKAAKKYGRKSSVVVRANGKSASTKSVTRAQMRAARRGMQAGDRRQ